MKFWITNDVVLLGVLMAVLGIVFATSSSKHPVFIRFYKIVPPLLLCYFIPSFLTTFHIADSQASGLYSMAAQYLLPAALVLITLSVDVRGIMKLGPKALIIFLSGSLGIVIGGPIALIVMHYLSPSTLTGTGADSVWRGLSTIAGSWIGGAPNQAALYQIFQPSGRLFSIVITVDIVISQIWMSLLLLGAAKSRQIDALLKSDSVALRELNEKIESLSVHSSRITLLSDLMILLGAAFGITALSKILGDQLASFFTLYFPSLEHLSLTSGFFWLIVLATAFGIVLSFTPLRNYEGAGASKFGSFFIYFLVATIGMKMDLMRIFDYPGLFLVGVIWISVHVSLMLLASKLLKAPFFFLAVGSQANIGGAASAPVVAAAFQPSLAPVGVLLAVLGYAIGTYGGWLSGLLMQWITVVLHIG